MTESRTIFKRRRTRYTSISNTALRDNKLTLEATGFLARVMSLPEDWHFHRAWARREYDIGREKLDRIVRELADAGYVRYTQERKADGTMGDGVYLFTDEPGDFDDQTPLPEKPLSGEPDAGDPAPTNNLALQIPRNEEKGATACAAGSPRSRPEAEQVAPISPVSPALRAELAKRLRETAAGLRMGGAHVTR